MVLEDVPPYPVPAPGGVCARVWHIADGLKVRLGREPMNPEIAHLATVAGINASTAASRVQSGERTIDFCVNGFTAAATDSACKRGNLDDAERS